MAHTIVACATPPGRGGVSVVRLSGPDAGNIGKSLAVSLGPPRQAVLRDLVDADEQIIDSALVIFFPAPHSFTGEDVVEIQCHGSPLVVDSVISAALSHGAQVAQPGEFSQRAFLNDRIDLLQAEAIADLIDATSQEAVIGAQRSLKGEFSEQIEQLAQQMIGLRVYIEAALDFPDEEVDFLADREVADRLRALRTECDQLYGVAQQGHLLRDGITVVISGPPNAGKSTLLNTLTGDQRAIVTEHAGTTRDLIRATISIQGMPVQIVDTAGLRETDNPVEQVGVELARQAAANADLIIDMTSADDYDWSSPGRILPTDPHAGRTVTRSTTPAERDPGGSAPSSIRVINKVDLHLQQLKAVRTAVPGGKGEPQPLYLSAKNGTGVAELKKRIASAAGLQPTEKSPFIARRRHLQAIEKACLAVERGVEVFQQQQAGELLAEELRSAHDALGEITGKVTSDQLLGEIFSSFCIGK